MPANTDTSLDKKEAARALKISLRHLDNLLRARAIEYMKIGRSVRLTPEAVQRFKESRTVRAIA